MMYVTAIETLNMRFQPPTTPRLIKTVQQNNPTHKNKLDEYSARCGTLPINV